MALNHLAARSRNKFNLTRSRAGGQVCKIFGRLSEAILFGGHFDGSLPAEIPSGAGISVAASSKRAN